MLKGCGITRYTPLEVQHSIVSIIANCIGEWVCYRERTTIVGRVSLRTAAGSYNVYENVNLF